MTHCRWDYCRSRIPKYAKRCFDHSDMKWWEEHIEHVKHLCWEEEEIPLDDFEDAINIVYDCREAGGPSESARRLEAEHGVSPELFVPDLDGYEMLK